MTSLWTQIKYIMKLNLPSWFIILNLCCLSFFFTWKTLSFFRNCHLHLFGLSSFINFHLCYLVLVSAFLNVSRKNYKLINANSSTLLISEFSFFRFHLITSGCFDPNNNWICYLKIGVSLTLYKYINSTR